MLTRQELGGLPDFSVLKELKRTPEGRKDLLGRIRNELHTYVKVVQSDPGTVRAELPPEDCEKLIT